MTYKHDFVDDYPYLAYSSSPAAVQPNAGDIADLKSADAALDARLDLIEADGWVTTDRIAAKAVTTAKLADAAVDTTQIKDKAVTTAKIADAAVDTAQIKDGAVTADKIAQ